MVVFRGKKLTVMLNFIFVSINVFSLSLRLYSVVCLTSVKSEFKSLRCVSVPVYNFYD